VSTREPAWWQAKVPATPVGTEFASIANASRIVSTPQGPKLVVQGIKRIDPILIALVFVLVIESPKYVLDYDQEHEHEAGLAPL
jgi:hypothetical protein